MIRTHHLFTLLYLGSSFLHGFQVTTTRPSFSMRISSTTLYSSEKKDATNEEPPKKESMSFDSATQALRDEEDAERAERSGSKVTEEDVAQFESKKGQYDAMRDKIRERASTLNIEKSVTTAQAIAEANARAMVGEKPQLDLSKFGGTFDPDEELTEEEMKEIDKTAQLNWFEQAKEELQNTKWPSPGATIRQAGFMLLIFVLTAAYILWLDGVLRDLFTNWGLIPRSDEVFDFSDLALPERWSEFMDESDLMKK